jgi:hypothetical protein
MNVIRTKLKVCSKVAIELSTRFKDSKDLDLDRMFLQLTNIQELNRILKKSVKK